MGHFIQFPKRVILLREKLCIPTTPNSVLHLFLPKTATHVTKIKYKMAKESQKRLLTKEECVNKNYLKYMGKIAYTHEILTKGYKLVGVFDSKNFFFK